MGLLIFTIGINLKLRIHLTESTKLKISSDTNAYCGRFGYSAANKALFDETTKGYGAIWSSRILFNSFNIPTPGQIIIDTNKQFRAEREDGIGYFYGGDTENRSIPEHPIIKKILNGKKCINEIIPSDITKDKEYWVPPKLWNLL